MALLEIKNLHAGIEDKEIIKGLSLTIEPGTVHAIMGPNGSGKSTLSNILAGHNAYTVSEGEVLFKGKNLLDMKVDERANEGLFLGFQYPTEIPGISYASFLKEALNAKRAYLGQEPLDMISFMKRLNIRAQALGVTQEMLKRSLNVGFSGGEKKRMETLQMAFLEPDFCILDEMDSGLDIDALRQVSEAVNVMRESGRSFLLITHYQRLLDYIVPDIIHVFKDGKIIETGDKTLALKLEEKGYADYQ